jgi:hypothetical protein
MRAPPPDAEIIITGIFCFVAYSTARVMRSPTTEPMEPMIKRESVTHKTALCPSIVPLPVMMASTMSVSS